MLNPAVILERFGDEDFLRELWLRARGQLPAELEGVESLLSGAGAPADLAKQLHKLRGLIANFLEGGQAIADLRRCEELCQRSGAVPPEPWESFRRSLQADAARLESWLFERGFPCS